LNISSLQKKIAFWPAVAIVVGSVVGSGLFIKPASMAAQLGSPFWLMLVWVLAGLFSLMGALVFAELGAMMPVTGGIYAYFRHMFGDFVAFLYGWAAFSVINTAAVAAIAYVCAQYADYFLSLPRFPETVELSYRLHIPGIGDLYPLQNIGVKALAALLVLVLTWLNYISVKAGSAFQNISTLAKVLVIGALVIGIFSSPAGSFSHFSHTYNAPGAAGLTGAIVVAMTGAFFAYDGWINISFMAGEIQQPQRNIPRSLLLGMLVCIGIYLLVNLAYLYALPVEKMAASQLVAADAVTVALGSTGAAIVAAMIIICTLGAVNGNLMATCRVTYAMGQDRVFAPWTGRIHSRFQSPGNALWLHAIWTCLYIFTGSFDMLADMFVFVTWIAYGAGAVGIFLLRRREPERVRPYRIIGYPFVPLLYIVFTGFYLVMTIWNDVSNYLQHRQPVINSLLGLFITALGIPLFFYYRKRNNASPRRQSS